MNRLTPGMSLPIGPDPALVARVQGMSAGARADSASYTRSGARIVPHRRRLPTIAWLLSPKWLTARARSRAAQGGRAARLAFLGVIGVAFWAFAFGALHRVLGYFRGVPEIGALLAGKLLGILLLSFASILLLSNVITSLSSFFLARDLDTVVASPVDWLTFYSARLAETVLHSSWMVLLLAVPMFTAWGVVYEGGPWFALVCLAGFLPFLLIPSVVGSALTLVLVNVFPARRTRDILGVITVLAGAGVAVFLRLMRPEQLARPEGFRSLVEFISVLRGPTSPFLPSEWLQRTLMGWLTFNFDPLSLYLLWSTAAAFFVLGALLHRALYARGFTKAQEGALRASRAVPAWSWLRFPRRLLSPHRRELVVKELRVFFRDTTQWSQLILLGVLVVVYVVNIRYLPLTGEGITFLIVNLIPFLNLALAGFVLASVAARFLFPGVSLEGRSWWLVRSSPIDLRDLLWAKYWVGTLPLLALALAIVGVTNTLLQVSEFMFAVSILTIAFMTFALAGLAVGFGALYPRFESENAAQIPTSFGGLLFMMTAVCLIGGIITLEARPVYAYLSARTLNTAPPVGEMVVGFGLAAALCLAATFVPLAMARKRLEGLER